MPNLPHTSVFLYLFLQKQKIENDAAHVAVHDDRDDTMRMY